MKITTNRYTAILTLQTFLLTIDWIMNIVGLVATQTNASMVTLLINAASRPNESKARVPCNRSYDAATIYYYCYKRASLRISDQRFYEDMDSGHADSIADVRRQIG
ncbi:hypothetical protein HUJ04_010140 [Dendroctonus ponderosae]|nr:hypothetical protein HUJ04_010140 [Dendroctonus ponderosae]